MMRHTTMLILLVSAGLTHADDIPHRKAGLWEVITQPSTAETKPMTHKLCLDRDTESLLNRMGSGTLQQDCSKNEMHVRDGKLVMHTVCALGGSQQTSDVVITFSGDTGYSLEAHSRYEPPMMGRAEGRTVQQGKWVGACPAGMQPGEMVMTDGRGREFRMNLNKMPKLTP